MKKDMWRVVVLILAVVMPLTLAVQVRAAPYVDPANEFVVGSGDGFDDNGSAAVFEDTIVWTTGARVWRGRVVGRELPGPEFTILSGCYGHPSACGCAYYTADIFGDIVVSRAEYYFNIDYDCFPVPYVTVKYIDTEEVIFLGDYEGQNPRVWGNIVVWSDYHGDKKISGADVSDPCNPQIFPVTQQSRGIPNIFQNIVVFATYLNNSYDIWAADISDPCNVVQFPVCVEAGDQLYPDIYSGVVVWTDRRNNGIYAADISDPCNPDQFAVCTVPAYRGEPAIYGTIVVWTDNRNGNGDIYGADIADPRNIIEFPVCVEAGDQKHPAIWGDTVVWEDERNGQWDLYLYGNKILSGNILREKEFAKDPVGGTASDPVNTATGNFYLHETDLAISGPGVDFEFTRAYNAKDSYNGPFGPGWTHSYNAFVASDPCSEMVLVKWGDGQGHYYLPDSNDPNSYHPAIGAVYDRLKKSHDNSWTVTQKNLTKYEFNTAGKLVSIVDKNGNVVSLTYDANNLDLITDSVGRVIDVVCDSNGLVQSLTDPNSRQIVYGYTEGKLTSVTDARGKTQYYTYDPCNGMLKTITDRRGIVDVNNIYDPNGRVIEQVNGRGKKSYFEYNTPSDNQTTIRDPLGRETIHTYDPFYRLISITDPCGNTVSYTYDNKSNRTSITDKKSYLRYFTYDDMGNVLTMTEPNDPNDPNTGAVTTVTYDANNNPLTKTEATGTTLEREWEYEYDPNGNLIHTVDPNGFQTLRSYTDKGLLATGTDANGHTTKYTYDTQSNLEDVNDALGNVTHYTYDDIGRVIKKTDARGQETKYSYDENNNLLTTTDANGKTLSYDYDENDNKISFTDKRGKIRTYHYNENNILYREVDPCTFDIEYGYDDVDNRVSVTDKRGKTTKYTYDVLNRLIDVNDPLGHHTRYTYDAKGNKLSHTDGLGNTWTYEYDALDRLTRETNPVDSNNTYEHDLLGRKVAVTDAKGNTTRYEYDVLDRLIQVTDAVGSVTKYEYDSVGNLTDIIDANYRRSTRSYDALNRLVSESDPLENTTEYNYDEVGNLIVRIDAMVRKTTYEYDELNRLTDVNYPDGTSVSYRYDENGNRVGMTDWNGSSIYEYDDLNRMTASIDAFGNRVEYEYDPAGNRTVIVYPDSNSVYYAYDDAGRLNEVNDWNGKVTTYSYDAAGNLKMVFLPNTAIHSYEYDDASRLISVQNISAVDYMGGFEYTLDSVGNRIEVNETGTLSPVITFSDADYSYDLADRLTFGGSCDYDFDDNGNQVERDCFGLLTEYSYDPEDSLVGVNKAALDVQHTYDGLGNRIARNVNGDKRGYVLDLLGSMSQVLCETDANDSITAYYIYGAGLLARISSSGDYRYYHYDGLGSTVALTDANGVITDRYSYLPFGELANAEGTTENPFEYIGQLGVMTEPDGTLFMRARFYDPLTGRFLSVDPAKGTYADPSSLYPYVYAKDNPILFYDPAGLWYLPAALVGVVSVPSMVAYDISMCTASGLSGVSERAFYHLSNTSYAIGAYANTQSEAGYGAEAELWDVISATFYGAGSDLGHRSEDFRRRRELQFLMAVDNFNNTGWLIFQQGEPSELAEAYVEENPNYRAAYELMDTTATWGNFIGGIAAGNITGVSSQWWAMPWAASWTASIAGKEFIPNSVDYSENNTITSHSQGGR